MPQDYPSAQDASSTPTPHVVLAMIVKNEAHGIEATLRSAAAAGVRSWLVLDTGSTDDTLAAVVAAAAATGSHVDLVQEPFVDFATTRNRALELAEARGDWVLMLDGDDLVVPSAVDLLQQLAALSPSCGGARVRVKIPGCVFASTRLFRSGGGYLYVGEVHEVCVGPGEPGAVDLQIDHFPPPQSQDATRNRWRRDVQVLCRKVDAEPNNTRAWFYLGLTYAWLGEHASSLWALHRRVELGGWFEELYYAKLQIARGLQALGRSATEIHEAFLTAHEACPHRAEALYELAHWCMSRGKLAHACTYASAALALPIPKDVLFVDVDAHGWKAADIVASTAFYLGPAYRERGLAAALQVVAAQPHDERAARNLAFYQQG